ncbi:MAG: nucleotidyltransferase family protein [Pseudomonadota bacterium]|nr:nucleotidyltransferase family protein [Pseudomonadota bacterium]
MLRWTAIVLAGSRPGRDAFADEMGCELKALIPVGGVPMVRRPVEALLASEHIGDVHVLAQDPERIATVLPADPRLRVGPSADNIAETLLGLCNDPSVQWPLLVTTADHALLDAEIIAEFCRRSSGDISIGLVERRVMLDRFPDARRTWLRFRGGAYSGANLFILRSPKVAKALMLWRSVEQDRKKAWRLLWALGPSLFVGAALRLRGLHPTLQAAGRSIGLSVRAVELADAIAAIDVDKKADLKLAERILKERK